MGFSFFAVTGPFVIYVFDMKMFSNICNYETLILNCGGGLCHVDCIKLNYNNIELKPSSIKNTNQILLKIRSNIKKWAIDLH